MVDNLGQGGWGSKRTKKSKAPYHVFLTIKSAFFSIIAPITMQLYSSMMIICIFSQSKGDFSPSIKDEVSYFLSNKVKFLIVPSIKGVFLIFPTIKGEFLIYLSIKGEFLIYQSRVSFHEFPCCPVTGAGHPPQLDKINNIHFAQSQPAH